MAHFFLKKSGAYSLLFAKLKSNFALSQLV